MKIKSVNPSNYEIIGEVEVSSKKGIETAVKNAHEAKKGWKEIGVKGRVAELKKLYKVFESNQEEYAKLGSQEMGMPINDSRYDLEDGLRYLKWYLDNAAKLLSPEITLKNNNYSNTVYYEPYGVAAVIIPWNFPFSNVIWQVFPNLIAGNVVVFKNSEETILCGKKLDEYFTQADLPQNVFQQVFGDGKVGEILVNQDIDLISFTGSTKTGQFLYEVAAKKMIKAVLELGGSAPGIVFQDADLEVALEVIDFNRFGNCGQICDGLKRLVIHESVSSELLEKLKSFLELKIVGDASDKSTQIGPLVAKRQLELIESQVKDAVEKGAKILTGGKRPLNLNGAFYQPTILTNIKPNMRVWKEEVFGPVLPVVTFKSTEEAIDLANDTEYGLGSYLFTQDQELANQVAQQLESGMVAVNSASYLNPESPFGGYKCSGLGREHGKYGLRELCQIKVVATPK